MSNTANQDDHYTVCPFCFNPIHVMSYLQPKIWICPVCDTSDREWNAMLTCDNCGYGPRMFECPHCQEDFDYMRLMGSFGPLYMDYMNPEKYNGLIAEYKLGDLNIFYGHDVGIAEETKPQIQKLSENITFKFPGLPNKVKHMQIINVQTDKSVQNNFWLHAQLYAGETEGDVGQIVLAYAPEIGMKLHKVCDVSRVFIFQNEKIMRQTVPSEISDDDDEKICLKKIDQLHKLIHVEKLSSEEKNSQEANMLIDCIQLTFDCLTKIIKAKKEPSSALWGSLTGLSKLVVRFNLTGKDMPWYDQNLNDHQKKSLKYFNRYLCVAFYNEGVANQKESKFVLSRKNYRNAVAFDPEPELAIQIHYNWAISINSIYNGFGEFNKNKVYEHIGNYYEMIAHFDEIIQQYALITEGDVKKRLQRMNIDAKHMVQKTINMDNIDIRYSESHNGQLILMPLKKEGEPLILRRTWAEYDLTN